MLGQLDHLAGSEKVILDLARTIEVYLIDGLEE